MNPVQTNQQDQFPTFRKLARFSSRRISPAIHSFRSASARLFFSRTSAKVYLTTATLITLFYTGTRWYGRRLLNQEKQRIASLGMATDWAQLRQPLPAESENFFSAPPFEGVFAEFPPPSPQLQLWLKKTHLATTQRNGSVRLTHPQYPRDASLETWCAFFRQLGTLPPASGEKSAAGELLSDENVIPSIKAILEASKRPLARFPLGASNERPGHRRSGIPLNQFNHMRMCLLLYGEAQLEAGHPEAALPVFRVFDHMAQAYAAEAGLSHHLCSHAFIRANGVLLGKGIATHAWPAEILTTLLEKNYPALAQASGQRAHESSRLAMTELFEHYNQTVLPLKDAPPWQHFLWERLVPEYYYIKSAVVYSKYFEALHASAKPLSPPEFWAEREVSPCDPLFTFGPVSSYGPFHDPKSYLLRLHAVPIMHATFLHLAAALELDFLTHGRYPTDSIELDNNLLNAKVSLLDIDGKMIRYTTNAAGSLFSLRSVGEDGLLQVTGTAPDDIVFSSSRETGPK